MFDVRQQGGPRLEGRLIGRRAEIEEAVADVLAEEAEACGVGAEELRSLLRTQAALVDRLLAAISEEHARASAPQPPPSVQRVERVQRLLAGDASEAAGIAYDFGAWHLGVGAYGPGCMEVVRSLADPLDRQLLLVRADELTVWAWLGGRRPFASREAQPRPAEAPPGVSLAFGEPATGLAGWRRTHRQARAALPIARLRPRKPTRYADVALVATIAGDDLLASSLRELYLAPLQRGRDDGARALETLRAYFAAEGNASSAAAILGVSRRTVSNRLHAIEARLGCCLATCAMEVEAVLRLEDLEGAGAEARLAS
ncbi:MAG TPA: helix-turn-helix domain-containing protein [Solirubrobacterales bacterium]|jgi:hypothetical protein|nr:helix-turn-helix domain-containing protein [Solirubrobacterales bacterium]